MHPGLRRLVTVSLLSLSLASSSGPAAAGPGSAVNGLTASMRRADSATEDRVNRWISAQTAGWSPNLGQLADAKGRAVPDVLYRAHLRDAQVYVTKHGLTHVFHARRPGAETAGDEEEVRPEGQRGPKRRTYDRSRLEMKLKGASIRPERARATRRLEGQGSQNYYLAHCPDGVLGVPTYGEVTFPDVYPGVDWVVRSEPGEGVHHDFVVQPGADASSIRLEYAGATSMEVSDGGQTLRVRTAHGEVREGLLSCFQGDRANRVQARFQLEGNVVTVALGEYDHSRPLTIDPPIVWSTLYGGTSYDGPRAIYCDDANSAIYVVGYTGSNDMPVFSSGTFYQDSTGGIQDGFIWKFSQLGVRLWATYYGGSDYETNTDCQLDVAGNLYVSGQTLSTNFPTQVRTGAYNQGTMTGTAAAYLIMFDATGVLQWATYFGGSGKDYGDAVTVDALGRVYLAGHSSSSDLPLANPGGLAYFQSALGSVDDAFIARFGTNGALEWSTHYGGAGGESYGYGVMASGSSVYLVGTTLSPALPTFDPGGGAYYQPANGGDWDAFIVRFDSACVRTWATYYGGNDNDEANQPVVDPTGNLFVYGHTLSTDLPTYDPGGTTYYQPTTTGGRDFFVAKFSPVNAPVWATYFGGTGMEFINGGYCRPLALDAQGGVYVTGFSMSTDYLTLNPPGSFFQGSMPGLMSATLTHFQNDGTLLWSTYLGQAEVNFGTGLAVSASGCVFATGETNGPGPFPVLDPGFGAWCDTLNAGGDDGYITKFCAPNSACCSDFNCTPVSSAAECAALGGTAFFAGQPCSTTTCTILCTICGRKFSDLNRNGVQDAGEPALMGWTIELRYPNGTLYATATTDAQGNYCFTAIPCGPWTVGEAQQPGWVQTAPALFTHSLALGVGTTQNGVNFGNYSCPTPPPCGPAPAGLSAWWPFSELPGASVAAEVAHMSPPHNVAHVQLGASGGGGPAGALCLAGPGDRAVIPYAEQQDLEFGDGSFSIMALLDANPGVAGRRTVVEKRVPVSKSGGDEMQGWALYLDGLQSMLEIGTGGSPQTVPGPTVTPGTWSHLAVTVDRAAGQGRWYVDGSPAPAFDFVPVLGPVTSAADVSIGQVGPAFGTASGFQGCIADLSLFNLPLPAGAIAKAGGGSGTPAMPWCPEFILMPQVTSMCPSQTSAQVCFKIFNGTATTQSYHWSLAGLPPGPGCTMAGPTQTMPSAGAVTVPAGSYSAAICVTIQRPANFTAQNAMSCFQVTLANDATGVCRARTAKLRADNTCWCATQSQPSVTGIAARVSTGGMLGIGIGHPCDPQGTLSYRLSALWLDPDSDDPLAVSLNGLPPGEPVNGLVSAGPGVFEQVNVQVSYPRGYDPSALYEIVLEADTDSDGMMERLSGTVVHPVSDTDPNVTVPPVPVPAKSLRLATSPNPFIGRTSMGFSLARAEKVELGIYDLSGRLVRWLARGRLEAGAHQFHWDGRHEDGRRASAGVYFVRLDAGSRHLEAKLVKAQ